MTFLLYTGLYFSCILEPSRLLHASSIWKSLLKFTYLDFVTKIITRIITKIILSENFKLVLLKLFVVLVYLQCVCNHVYEICFFLWIFSKRYYWNYLFDMPHTCVWILFTFQSGMDSITMIMPCFLNIKTHQYQLSVEYFFMVLLSKIAQPPHPLCLAFRFLFPLASVWLPKKPWKRKRKNF